jgi:uncharacterized protein YecE (DUF72 family)
MSPGQAGPSRCAAVIPAQQLLSCLRIAGAYLRTSVDVARNSSISLRIRYDRSGAAYSDEDLEDLAKKLTQAARSVAVWCIFDNTAVGAATANALNVLGRLASD